MFREVGFTEAAFRPCVRALPFHSPNLAPLPLHAPLPPIAPLFPQCVFGHPLVPFTLFRKTSLLSLAVLFSHVVCLCVSLDWILHVEDHVSVFILSSAGGCLGCFDQAAVNADVQVPLTRGLTVLWARAQG